MKAPKPTLNQMKRHLLLETVMVRNEKETNKVVAPFIEAIEKEDERIAKLQEAELLNKPEEETTDVSSI